MGVKISDKGIFTRVDEKLISPAPHEVDIFTAVGLPWIPPELRENTGEVEAAARGRLPKLVEASDLRGDLHMHTIASDGVGTAAQMAEAAASMGHEYIAITDHTKSLAIAKGLDEARLLAQMRHLAETEQSLGRLRILRGVEVDILEDGSLDIDVDVLARLDWVIASVHSHLDMSGAEMTDRLIRAMESGAVDCIGHPSGRRIGHRKGAVLDIERLLTEARRFGVAVECNGNPHRMDLRDVDCHAAREAGVPVAVNTDAHAPRHLKYQEYGLITARRGWLEAGHVLNCRPWTDLVAQRQDRLRHTGVAVDTSALPPWSSPKGDGTARSDPHYPELPADDPLHIDLGSVPEAAEAEAEADDLASSLVERPLDPALRDRIDDWLRNGGDDALEVALQEMGDNAMQVAFSLLYAAPDTEP